MSTELRLIGTAAIAAARSAIGPRGRAMVCFHEPADAVQRMVNAIEPGSYIQPHRHVGVGRMEVCIALTGAAAVLTFGDDGDLLEQRIIAPGSAVVGVEIPPGTFHSLLALAPGTALYEVHQGPYVAATHRQPAPWAPSEGDPTGVAWLEARR
jgi:cupin fold WbuC family metalloprotein